MLSQKVSPSPWSLREIFIQSSKGNAKFMKKVRLKNLALLFLKTNAWIFLVSCPISAGCNVNNGYKFIPQQSRFRILTLPVRGNILFHFHVPFEVSAEFLFKIRSFAKVLNSKTQKLFGFWNPPSQKHRDWTNAFNRLQSEFKGVASFMV